MPMPALVSSMPMPSYVSHKLLYPPPPHSPVGIAAHFSPHYNFFLLLNSALELVAVDLFWKRKIITGGETPVYTVRLSFKVHLHEISSSKEHVLSPDL